MRRLLTALTLLLPLLGSACLDSTEPAAPPRVEDTIFHPDLDVDLTEMLRLDSGLYLRTLEFAEGDTALLGDSAVVRYTGWLPTGQQFDTNRIEGRDPLTFRVGAGDVIPGFEQGVAGMTVGSRRQLVIPSELAYGRAGRQGIPPNSILVFEVELIGVKDGG